MCDEIKKWIETTLILGDDHTSFEKVGLKRVIFARSYQAPLVSLLIEPLPAVPIPWRAVGTLSLTESLFARLKPVLLRYECWWFFASMPQHEHWWLRWVMPYEERTQSAGRFYTFENIGSEAGPQTLGLLIDQRRGLLTFSLSEGLEIAFYGPDSLWEEISSALHGD